MFCGATNSSDSATNANTGESNTGGGSNSSASSNNGLANSKEAAEYNQKLGQWCKDNGLASNVDFTGFDPRVSYALAGAVNDAKRDFPELNINYLGTISNQVGGIRESLEALYTDLFQKGFFPENEAKMLAKNYAAYFIERWKLDKTAGTYAWSFPAPGELDRFAGIAVNDMYAGDYDEFQRKKQQNEKIQWSPVGCGTVKSTADHEVGHEIDRLLGASNDSQIIAMYEKVTNSASPKDLLSLYSTTNVKEFIAEAYSEYRNNPNPREVSRFVYNRLIELRDQKVKEKVLKPKLKFKKK